MHGYTLDGAGRIMEMTDYDGRKFKMAYEAEEATEQKSYTIAIYDVEKKAVRFQRTRAEGATLTMEEGVTRADLPIEKAKPDRMIVMKKIHSSYRTVSSSVADGKIPVNYEHDANGLRISDTDTLGKQVRREYDRFGNEAKRLYPDNTSIGRWHNDQGLLIRSVGEFGQESVQDYDTYGRKTLVIDPDGKVTQFEYPEAGSIDAIVDGNLHRFTIDKLARVREHHRPGGSSTAWEYNARENIISQTVLPPQVESEGSSDETKPIVTRYEYNLNDRLHRVLHPAGQVERLEYNNVGLLAARIGFRGEQTGFRYDEAFRLKEKVHPGGGRIESWRYDEHDRVIRYDTSGASDPRSIVYGFNDYGQLAWEEQDGRGRTRHFYDQAGRRIRTVYPDRTETLYHYDRRDRLTRTSGNHEKPQTYQYGTNGQRILVDPKDAEPPAP